jgi:Protein of unknown function (DUF1549)
MITPKARTWLSAGALAVLACSNSSSSTPAPPLATGNPAPPQKLPQALTCDDRPDPHCANPISRILVPMLRGAGVPIVDASPAEVCRRMAVDLVGRVPTAQEAAACTSQTFAQMADAFMAEDDYARTQARAWGELTQYDIDFMWPKYTAELDGMVRDLYRGKLAYADFVTAFITHPGFFQRHLFDDWTAAVFNLFLGRPARTDEVEAMRPLTYVWNYRFFCDGFEWYTLYEYERQSGMTDTAASQAADQYCTPIFDPYIDPLYCAYAPGGGCRSTALGPEIVLNTVQKGRTSTVDPGATSTVCPDGVTRAGCGAREETFTGPNMNMLTMAGPLASVAPLDDASRKLVNSIGGALATRRDFWETEANREILRLVGWWMQGFRRPDYDVPDIRAVVADMLQSGTSVRDMQKTIVTSLLYTLPAAAPAAPPGAPASWTPPIFATGPTKFLGAESWLDSAGLVVGETLGSCDYRYMSSFGYDETYRVDPSILESKSATLVSGDWPPGQYLTTAQQLGGCSSGAPRPTFSSVGITYAQHATAQIVCGLGRAVVPSGTSDTSDAALANVARVVVASTLSRPATDAEATELGSEMSACLAQGASSGCADAPSAARWLCQKLVDSAEFSLY